MLVRTSIAFITADAVRTSEVMNVDSSTILLVPMSEITPTNVYSLATT
jgi:hypothetical protein